MIIYYVYMNQERLRKSKFIYHDYVPQVINILPIKMNYKLQKNGI